MSFVNPYLLFGLFAIAIPVLIHLFNFRKFRKVYFSNVGFLKDLKQQTRRQSKLRHLVILFLRILAVISLVFAFAQPYIPSGKLAVEPQATNAVSIFIDNSFSMGAEGSGGSLLDQAKARAREIAAAYRSTDAFQLLTNDFMGKHQRLVSQEEFNELVEEVNLSPSVRRMSEVMSRQKDILSQSRAGGKRSFLLSDFQQSVTDIDNMPADSNLITFLVPLQAGNVSNLYIDSCWFLSPVHQINQSVRLIARISNYGENDFEKIPVRLMVNGKQKALASVDLRSNDEEDVELIFTSHEAGIQYASLEISDFPISYDDEFYLVYDVAKAIPVLAINGRGDNAYLRSLFGRDSSFVYEVNDAKNIDFNRLPEYKLIILNELQEIYSGLSQELRSFINNGGSLVVIPTPGMDLLAYREFLSSLGVNYYGEFREAETRVADLDLEHPVFSDVFENSYLESARRKGPLNLPAVKGYFGLSRLSQAGQMPLLRLLNGDVFLSAEVTSRGKVYLLTVPLNDSASGFPRHAIFVPVMYRIGLLSAATDPLYYVLGRNNEIEITRESSNNEIPYKIRSREGDMEFIPQQWIRGKKSVMRMNEQPRDAGLFEITLADEVARGVAFNYDRAESRLAVYDPAWLADELERLDLGTVAVLQASDKPLTQAIEELNQGKRLWKLFIILALAFLAAEVILLRFWK